MASPVPVARPATHEDIPAVLAMVRELAHYEKALDKVEATEASLAATLTLAPSSSHPDPPTQWASCFVLVKADSADVDATTLDPSLWEAASLAAQVTDQKVYRSCQAGEEILGMALYFTNYSTWLATPGVYLEDLYVRPVHRRKGYATLLFKALAEKCESISGGRGRLEWSCLKWNESALRFYRGLGAAEMEEWIGLRVEGQDGLNKLKAA